MTKLNSLTSSPGPKTPSRISLAVALGKSRQSILSTSSRSCELAAPTLKEHRHNSRAAMPRAQVLRPSAELYSAGSRRLLAIVVIITVLLRCRGWDDQFAHVIQPRCAFGNLKADRPRFFTEQAQLESTGLETLSHEFPFSVGEYFYGCHPGFAQGNNLGGLEGNRSACSSFQ